MLTIETKELNISEESFIRKRDTSMVKSKRKHLKTYYISIIEGSKILVVQTNTLDSSFL